MDKLINKVKQDVKNSNMKKAKKDLKVLSKADKKFDKKIEQCEKMRKKK